MSCSQGWHHDAKNVNTTVRPRSADSVTGLPSSPGSVKSGARLPIRARFGVTRGPLLAASAAVV